MLPDNVAQFLAACLGVDKELIITEWTSRLRRELESWDTDPPSVVSNSDILELFIKHGTAFNIGYCDIFPPVRCCPDQRCYRKDRYSQDSRPLTALASHPVTVFTQNLGPIPAWSYSAHCTNCRTRFYGNFYVEPSISPSRRIRVYYPGVPSLIQISMHYYVESFLASHFVNEMVCAWVSATNNARIYNLEHAERVENMSLHIAWPRLLDISAEQVWDAFFTYALLLDASEQPSTMHLQLDHGAPSHDMRLKPAIQKRNLAMVGTGQELWNHACDLCCKIRDKPDGQREALRAIVSDGVSLGCPCCSILNCQEPLPSQRAQFCFTHRSESDLCCIDGCRTLKAQGHETCEVDSHRSLERVGVIERTAMFQLRKRLEKLKTSTTESALATPDTMPAADELVEIDENGACDGKSETGNSKPRARFGRRRTHNEQLGVATCGIILGRATFYGSEGVYGHITFLKKLFPIQRSLPGVIFYDNNCITKKVLASTNDNYFEHCMMPVDVFHMKTKHKSQDTFCDEHCNATRFPDLITDGKWTFNSSAAEMTNAWFGGYQAMVRDMRIDRYTFFLDEMIKHRNRITLKDLKRRGAKPYQIPREDLLVD